MNEFRLELGLKTDPIEYRYSLPWLFRLLQEIGVRRVQLGTFFELYHLPDEWFIQLRNTAADFGLDIASLFTAHRELGGLLRPNPAWHAVARSNLRRLVEVGALLGCECVGHNAGAVMRDEMGRKADGLRRHVDFMKELLDYAGTLGVECLTLEPMSCPAEPPATPEEIRRIGEELGSWAAAHPTASAFGYCADVSHGVIDADGTLLHPPLEALEAALPWLRELHLKNTDARLEHTFGFAPEEIDRGIVNPEGIRDFLFEHAGRLPVTRLTGYLEIGGPKLGRDHSDPELERELRESLHFLRRTFSAARSPAPEPDHRMAAPTDGAPVPVSHDRDGPLQGAPAARVQTAPSVMCCDLRRTGEEIRRLEALGVDWLHFDIMDAHFTPNMPLGLEIIRQLREITRLPFDIHLMVDRVEFFVDQCLELGANRISVHVEATPHLDRVLGRIRDAQVEAGVALNPATPLTVLEWCLERLDFVLLMTVNPGFAGQKLAPGAVRKIGECRRRLAERGAERIRIQVDGNVSIANIPRMVQAGATDLVLGTSSLFRHTGSLEDNWAQTRAAIGRGLQPD
ncbi:MAG: ribulose-phosphate 3-epimerase [Kiritimatiellaeota bacterium]|nr:ribulose-phosphate 3-epimerase [Kiritimatiellota bacterium]